MRNYLFVVTLFLACMPQSVEGSRITEADIFKLVKANNGLVQSAQKDIDASEIRTGYLSRSFLPKASLHAGEENFRYVTDQFQAQPFYGAQLELNIYNGGRDRIKDDLTFIDFEKEKAKTKITLFEQVEDARKSYWQAIFLRQLIFEYEQIQNLVRSNRGAALKRIRSGVATASDKFEFEIKDIEISQYTKKLRLSLDKEIGHLKILLGLDIDKEISLGEGLIHDHNWRGLIAHSEQDHSYIVEPQKLEVTKSDIKASLAGRKWLPRVDAYALWLQNNQRRDFDRQNKEDRQQTAVGLKATWNFSDFVEGDVQKKSFLAQSESNSLKLNFKKHQLENELHFELKELEILDQMVHSAQINIEKSQRFFQLITKEYKRGVKTSGDMLAATEKVTEARVKKMTIIKDFHFARAHILAKLGR